MLFRSGAGCSHGHAQADNGILQRSPAGQWSALSNLSQWLLANPGAKGAEQPLARDYEPDGTWFSMVFELGRLYALEPNHGLLVSVHPELGTVELERDLFATFGDHTYTTMATYNGDLYIGTLGRIVQSFDASIYRLSREGIAEVFATGLKAVLGLTFDRRGQLYAIQSPIFVPGTGSLVRVDQSGGHEVIVSGLTFPSALTLGPDGALYVSVCGYHCQPGQGQILRIVVP